LINIDLRSSQPLYEQIIAQIKEMVVRGLLRPGDAIPSIRKLSVMTRINPNTVARAYQELERMGIIETLTGRGTFIRESPHTQPDEATLAHARELLRPPLMEMKLMKLSAEQIMREIGEVLRSLEGESK